MPSIPFLVVWVAALTSAADENPAAKLYDGPTDLTPACRIDELVFADLKRLDIQPSNVCSDAVFVRRVYLDVLGTLPTAQEAREFLSDQAANKRGTLIDRLLERKEYADYWAMKWSDLLRVKAEFPINLWPNAAQAYYRWIQTSLKDNVPYDRFARQLLSSNGSNFRVGQVNFYRATQNKTPEGIAQAVALTFMGTRGENWPKERWAGMAAFFSQISFRSTGEWKEEIVAFDPNPAKPPESASAPPAPVFPDGTAAKIAQDEDPRIVFADWLTGERNPWFSRCIANRVWFWLLGRGIVHEPDDFRDDNPPGNPELLDYLAKELSGAKYDLKHLMRLILNSKTYQLSSIGRSDKPEAAAHFARYPLRRLEAEVLIDALNQITGTTEQYSSSVPEPFTYLPDGVRSISLPDGSITSPFLEMFGRPPRDTGLASERSNRSTTDQRLHLLNSSHIQRKIENSPKLLAIFQSAAGGGPSSGKPPRNKPPRGAKARAELSAQESQRPVDAVNELYLTVLSRFPTDEELKKVAEYAKAAPSKREAVIDLAWALINSAEFQYRH